jgi:DNA-directed RNA polymerase I subunit RPA1
MVFVLTVVMVSSLTTPIAGHLLVGVLDKSQFGASIFGLVHSCFELVGPEAAGDLLTALGRLFTTYIQRQRGFTCGIDDLRLQNSAENSRREMICNSRRIGVSAAAGFTRTSLSAG